jgi:hypothetical protein
LVLDGVSCRHPNANMRYGSQSRKVPQLEPFRNALPSLS